MGASSACCKQEQCQPPCVEVEAGSEPGAQQKNVAPALRSPGTTEAETFDENASQSLETVSENSNNSSCKKVLTVRTGLMRGIALKETLRRGGRLWRTPPMDLPEQEKASLWCRSRPVSHFDVFISHTWSTRGCWKYLSLSFQYGWAHILLTWLVAVMLVELLFCLDLLPPCTTVRMYFQGFDAECPFGGWALYVASPLAMLAFFVAPYCPDLCGEKQSSFLDVVSINQCDKKMQEGIYGLGGFLSASKELRILYSPSYFSRRGCGTTLEYFYSSMDCPPPSPPLPRLWCLFELGAFRKANPAGRIRLAPLFVEVGLAIFWMGGSASILLLLLFINRTGAKILPAFVPLVLVFHTIRKSLTKKRQLLSDLENFEVTAALCRKTSDRDFVYGAIEEWYGGLDAFSEYVRGPLREELLADHSGSNLPPHYALLIMTPWISLGLDALVAQARAGAPMHCLLSYGFGVTLGLFTCWGVVMLQFGMFLCDRYPLPKASIWAVPQSLSLFILFLGTCFAGITVGTWAYKHSVTASMIWFVVTLLLALLCNYGSKAKACVGRVKKQAPADMREAPKAAVHADWLEV